MKGKVLITGTSQGIGKATALLFIKNGFEVIGLDRKENTISLSIDLKHRYTHYKIDITDKEKLPDISGVNILINNAGTQNTDDITNNLIGTINVTERYGIQSEIKSILMVSSASALTGAEFPEYCASKGGMNAYGKNVALRIAKYGATCNNLCPGGVITDLNKDILEDSTLFESVLDETLLHRWATAEEIAEWIYFLTVTNKFMTAQSILVDGGEADKSNFIFPGFSY